MDKIVFIPSALLALILFVTYGYFHWKNKHPFQTTDILITSIFQAFTIVAGIMLIVSTFVESCEQYITQRDQYIFIAGAAIIGITGDKIVRKLIKIEQGNRGYVKRRVKLNR